MNRKPVTLRAFKWKARPDLKWEVSWPHSTPGKRRLQRRFATKTTAQDFYSEKLREINNTGRREAGLPDEWVRDAAWARTQLEATGVSLRDVVADYMRRNTLSARSVVLQDAANAYLEHRERSGLAPRSLHDVRVRLPLFIDGMPLNCRISDIEKSDVERWLASLKGSSQTKKNYQRVLHAFLEWAKLKGYCEGNAAALRSITGKKAKLATRPVQIFTPTELRKILDNCPQEILAFHVLGAFCGIRSAELSRLDWSDVNFLNDLVSVSPEQSKTASRRFVPLPNVAKQWLQPISKNKGRMAPINVETYHNRKFHRELELQHGLKWKGNGLRHSFASYALALHEDAPRVSLWLGQETPSVIFKNYRERATKADAKAYFDTAPVAPGWKALSFPYEQSAARE